MTTCELILNPITRMVEVEEKDLDKIAESVCPTVEHGREKIIRIIKDFLGEEYLIEHAKTLKYDVNMAQMAKKRKHKKIDANADKDSKDKPTKSKLSKPVKSEKKELSLHDVAETLKDLIKATSENTVISALEAVLHREIRFEQGEKE